MCTDVGRYVRQAASLELRGLATVVRGVVYCGIENTHRAFAHKQIAANVRKNRSQRPTDHARRKTAPQRRDNIHEKGTSCLC